MGMPEWSLNYWWLSIIPPPNGECHVITLFVMTWFRNIFTQGEHIRNSGQQPAVLIWMILIPRWVFRRTFQVWYFMSNVGSCSVVVSWCTALIWLYGEFVVNLCDLFSLISQGFSMTLGQTYAYQWARYIMDFGSHFLLSMLLPSIIIKHNYLQVLSTCSERSIGVSKWLSGILAESVFKI